MSISALLYIILGLSVGVGVTLIYLQERFVRERRLLVSLHEGDKEKFAAMLKELDEKWEQNTAAAQQELEESRHSIEELREALELAEQKNTELVEAEGRAVESVSLDEDVAIINELKESVRQKDEELIALQADNKALRGSLDEGLQEITNLHSEIDFLKGEVESVTKEKNEEILSDDDFLVLTPGSHYLPGSVARALMGKKK